MHNARSQGDPEVPRLFSSADGICQFNEAADSQTGMSPRCLSGVRADTCELVVCKPAIRTHVPSFVRGRGIELTTVEDGHRRYQRLQRGLPN